tara:strand:- start:1179 stop:1682 length:504 start_codon:yes stop_codon:yes gene_type:complete
MFDPNRNLLNMVAHEYLTHEINKKISSDDSDRIEDASEIAYIILQHPIVKQKLAKVVSNIDDFEDTVFGQARHDIIGAIPLEAGETINVALDLVEDTYKTGTKGIDTISLGRVLFESLNKLPKPKSSTTGGTRRKLKRLRKRKMTNKYKQHRSKKSKKYRKKKTKKY